MSEGRRHGHTGFGADTIGIRAARYLSQDAVRNAPAVLKATSWGRCGGWLVAEECLHYQVGTALAPMTKARHPQDCPPPEERKAAPPRVNEREQECERCGSLVPAGTGELLRADYA
ncbi:hypothetical protein [Streptomyces olivaceoviridis]|uniref:hypothetical protein n=1 Tax=Streptomyces olivaceoviridis TaxID=1921 RepID=UPI00331F95D0